MAPAHDTEEEPSDQVDTEHGEEDDSEADAEGEVEDGSEADAEGEDDDEIVGAVKTRSLRRNSRRQPHDEDEDEDAEVDVHHDTDEDSSESGAEKDWEAADEDVEDEVEVTTARASHCTFCGQDEEHDPGEEFEEWLACAVCGDNAHRQCARENDALTSDEDAAHWRCKDCVSHGLEEESRVDEVRDRRQSSASKMARELFPATRGGIDPESHSVFNTLILDEDPLDGSRALRKRKTPMDDDDDEPRPAIRKRSKPSGEVDEDESAIEDEVTVAIAGGDGTDDAGSPRSRTGRPQRQLIKNRRKGMRIVSQSDDPRSLVIGIAVTAAQWDDVVKTVEKKQRRRERDRQRRARNARTRGGTVEAEEPQHFPAVQTTMYTNPFYAFPDRETDENKGKPYGGILNEAEADTAKTYPQDADRKAFSEARERAEEKWKEKMAQANGETTARTKQPGGLPSKIKCINFGGYEIDTWHAAPYPEEYSRNKHLYICEFCLKYMSSDFVAWRHKLKCSAKHPPGDEIYRDNITNPETGANTTLSFWEVDGRRNPLYCQNLCLLAKLFLGSKTLYYDVEPFLFYIMTENDEFGCHFVGYFSKEKRGPGPPPPLTLEADGEDHEETQATGDVDQETQTISNDPVLSSPGNNVSCILVLPVHMRRGFGRVLIEFSYLLTKQECRTGSPEKPLSDMGLVSYRSYWRTVLCRLLLRYKDEKSGSAQISIAQIARETGMTPDDIISTLESLRFLVRDPITKTYAMRLDYEYMREYVDKHDKKATIQLNQELLLWTAYVMGKPTNLFAMGEEVTINQPMQTVAPRAEAIEPPKEPEKDVQQTMIEGIAHQAKSETSQHDTVEPTTEEAVPNGSQGKEVSRTTPPDTAAAETNGNITSPTRRSPRKTPNGIVPIITTSRPRSQTPEDSYGSGSQPTPADMIPPTRFEVFPPIPGAQSAAKRRPGRPTRGGSARRSHHATPNRTTPARRSSARRSTPTTATREPSGRESLRRTRSKLGTMALAADDNEVAVEDDEDDQDAERNAGGADADAVPDVEMGDADANGEEDEDEDAPGSDDDEIKYE